MQDEQYQSTFFALDGRFGYVLAFRMEIFFANVALYHNVKFFRKEFMKSKVGHPTHTEEGNGNLFLWSPI